MTKAILDDAAPATLEEVQRHAARMRVLYDASRAFAEQVGDPQRLLTTIARSCSQLIGDFSGVTLECEDAPGWIEHAAVHHPDPDLERDYRAVSARARVRAEEGFAGRAMIADAPMLLPEVDPMMIVNGAPAEFRDAAMRLNVCSLVVVPMHARGRVIGAVSMARSRKGASYSESDVLYLQDLADRAALALESARLYSNLERRVADATAKLESVNRELEAFSYSVAHDLRAPLRTIDGFSAIVLEDNAAQLDEEGQKHLRTVREAARHMGQLIDGLLELSRLGRTEVRRTRVDLSQLAEQAVERIRRNDPERSVEIVIAPELAAMGDARLLGVVLDNLLGNAWKFTRKTTTARIEVGCEPGEERMATFFVRDNGAGFDETYASKLFGVFQRLHSVRDFEGTGIGLATVRRVIERHDGRVWAKAEVGKGATFFFTMERG